MESHEEIRDHKRIMRGMKELSKKCATCGRPKTRHTIQEAKHCMKNEGKDTRATQMTDDDINNAEFMKV